MDQVLIYSDSLSWGIIPGTRKRLPFAHRWPGVLEASLIDQGRQIRVVENCLNGRNTLWPDADRVGRNGSEGLAQVIEMHSPLKLVVLMLGTNDFQPGRAVSSADSANGIAKLIRIIREAPLEPGMDPPAILVVAPPQLQNPSGNMTVKFAGAEQRSLGLPQEIARAAREASAYFFDSNSIVSVSAIDGVHLDQDRHYLLGKALAKVVHEILSC